MAKVYTAQEMREEAEFQEGCHGKPYIIATMLRQAADALEREEKREKNKDALEAKDEEIAKRDALIKELADDLSGYLCESECNVACSSFGHCCSQTSHQIVAKAREVAK